MRRWFVSARATFDARSRARLACVRAPCRITASLAGGQMGDSADRLQVLDYSTAVQKAFTAVAWVNSCVGMDVSSIYQVGGALDPPPRCLS